MKICQIVPSLEEQHGGPSRSVHDLSAALAAIGHEVELLATVPGRGMTRSFGGLAVRIYPRNWPRRICRSAGLKARLREGEAELIHHHALWLRTLHYAHRTAVRRKVPLVVSARGMMSEWAWEHHHSRKHLARRLIHPGALEAVTGWHATSEAEAQEIRSRGFDQPICIAPNGVSEPAAESLVSARGRWRQLCPSAADRPVALFYSRFHRKKRVLELIDLWLERAPSEWLLLLVGIPQEYTPESLEEYAERHGAQGRVVAFSGAGRPPPFAVASLFVLPSHNENFGLAISEALAHGIPALVTDTTPWSGLNTNGAGWCVPWEQFPAALQAATSEAPERLQERGQIGRAWVLREYTWERPARLLSDFYARLRA